MTSPEDLIELTPEARQMITAAKLSYSPSESERQRGLERLRSAVHASNPVAKVQRRGIATLSAAGALTATWQLAAAHAVKWAGGALLVALAGLGTFSVVQRGESTDILDARSQAAPVNARPATQSPAQPVRLIYPEAHRELERETRTEVAVDPARGKQDVGASAAPQQETKASTLLAEARTLREVNELLKSGQPAAAMGRLNATQPQVLVAEWQLTRAIAGCLSGEPGGSAAASKLLSKFPRTPLAWRVEHACGLSSEVFSKRGSE